MRPGGFRDGLGRGLDVHLPRIRVHVSTQKLRQVRRAKQFGAMTEEVPEAAVPETAVSEAAAVAVPEESATVQSAAVPSESAEAASPAPVQSAAPIEGASLDALLAASERSSHDVCAATAIQCVVSLE